MTNNVRQLIKKIKIWFIRKLIIKVSFLDKDKLHVFSQLSDIYRISIENNQGREIVFVFKEDRRKSLPGTRSYIIEAYFDDSFGEELKEATDFFILSVVCVRFGLFKLSYKPLCLYLIDCYFDEVIRVSRARYS